MQITFYSEDHPKGLTADWPFAPRVGEFIEIDKREGTTLLRVGVVTYHMNRDGTFHSVRVDLLY